MNERETKQTKATRVTKAFNRFRAFRYSRLFRFSTLVFHLFFFSPAFGQTTPLPASLLDDGVRLIGQGRFSEALDALNRFKQISLSDARPYFYAGMAEAELGHLNAAALELVEAGRLDPGKIEILVLQANVYSRLKQNEAAFDALSRVENGAGFGKLETAWLWLLSDSYYRLEQADRTLRMLDLIEKQSPKDGRVDLLRGQAMARKGEQDEALAMFKRSLEKSPALAAAHLELGKIFYQRNEMSAARAALSEGVRLDPKQTEGLLKLGQACLALGKTSEAIEALTRVEQLAPSLAQTYYSLSNAFSQSGDRAKSATYRRKFQEISREQKAKEERDQQLSRLIAQGEAQLDQGHESAARELFLVAATAAPDNWDARGYLVELYLDSNDWKLAYPHLVRMEAIEPDSAVGNFLTARYLYKNREYEKALVYAEKVRLVRPGNAELRNLIGGLHFALGQTEKAALEFEAAVRLAPDRADYVENLRKVRKPE